MTEEPFRWVEAIQSRREYIEHQLSGGSPIVAAGCRDGVLLLTLSQERQKLFEIYDRIAMGGIGHPGDIERLRMLAIEVTSAEGFNRSALDVSLRRLVSYSLSPTLKAAFEQLYGAPYLARLLFAEMGRTGEGDLFIRVEYDGAFHTNGRPGHLLPYAVLSGNARAGAAMERYLAEHDPGGLSPDELYDLALDTWVVGHLTAQSSSDASPTRREIDAGREQCLASANVEAAFLDRHSRSSTTYLTVEGRPSSAIPRIEAGV